MMNCLWENEEMSFNAVSIAMNSVEKTEKDAGRRKLWTEFLQTMPEPTMLLVLEPTV